MMLRLLQKRLKLDQYETLRRDIGILVDLSGKEDSVNISMSVLETLENLESFFFTLARGGQNPKSLD